MNFRIFESAFVAVLSFKRFLSKNVKCTTLPNQPCIAKPILIDLNPDELRYYPFLISLSEYDGCNNLDNLSGMIFNLSDRICK